MVSNTVVVLLPGITRYNPHGGAKTVLQSLFCFFPQFFYCVDIPGVCTQAKGAPGFDRIFPGEG